MMVPSSVRIPHNRNGEQLKKPEWDEPLSPYAKLFLQRLRPEEHDLVIHAVIGFDSAVDIEELRTLLRQKIVKLRRFSSIVVTPEQGRGAGGDYRWMPAEVDIDMHLKEVDVSDFQFPEGSDPVLEYINSVHPEPLDITLPLWEMHVLRHPPRAGIAGTLLLRLHHALGDGVALASLLLELARMPDGARASLPTRRPHPKAPGALLGSLATLLVFLWNTVFAMTRLLLVLFLPPDRPSPLKAEESVRHLPRRITLSPPGAMPLADVKAVAAAVGGTVNEVLVMALTLAASLYAAQEGEGLPPMMRYASVVNLREPLGSDEINSLLEGGTNDKWGTRTGVIVHPVPRVPAVANVKDERERAEALLNCLLEVMKHSACVKRSWQAQMSFFTNWLITIVASPKGLLHVLLRLFSKVTLAMSNLPGPCEEILFLGSRVKSIHNFVTGIPMASNVHVLSYAGDLHYCFNVHPGTVLHPEALSRCFADAVQELKSAVKILALTAKPQR